MLKAFLFVLAIAGIFPSIAATAAEIKKYDLATFEQAKASGRPVLVDVKAWWCPVCAAQNHKIKEITKSAIYDRLLILEINYDSQKVEWRKLDVKKQGTLIGYKGPNEVGRIEFKTDRDRIETLLKTLVG